jgi:hypothetical protein
VYEGEGREVKTYSNRIKAIANSGGGRLGAGTDGAIEVFEIEGSHAEAWGSWAVTAPAAP